jgi:Ran GTPase-activating protein (RanGAP) involved in mRNA processing and transport
MSTPEEWRRIAEQNSLVPRFGLETTLDRLGKNDPGTTRVELTGWKITLPHLLANSLTTNYCLTHLSLQACNLRDHGCIHFVCPALKRGNPPLRYLNLSGNSITNAGAIVLGDAVENHKTLKELYLCWNGIADEGAQALANALETNALQVLDLGGLAEGRGGGRSVFFDRTETSILNFGDAGCSALAQALPQCHLQRLILSRQNRITSTGIIALACSLVNSRHLLHLELQRIPVDDDGAIAIATAIGHPGTVLRTLDLTINKITNRGAIALANSLISNCKIMSIAMTQNSIGLAGLKALHESAVPNITLQRLELYGHAAGREGSTYVWKIKPWLRRNRSTQQILQSNEGKLYSYLLGNAASLENCTRLFQLICEMPLVFERFATTERKTPSSRAFFEI